MTMRNFAPALYALAVLGAAPAGAASVVSFEIQGTCTAGDCITFGPSLSGFLMLDEWQTQGGAIPASAYGNLFLTLKSGSPIGLAAQQISGSWPSATAPMALQLQGATAISPQTGVALVLSAKGPLNLTGTIDVAAGACSDATCSQIVTGIASATFVVSMTGIVSTTPGPQPVPVPAALPLLAGAGAALAGLGLVRRRAGRRDA